MKSRSVVVVILCVFSLVAIIGGITYARFVYEKDLADIAVTTGQISINIQNVVNNASLPNAVPTIDNTGKASSNYLDFEITGTVDSEPIYYEVYMVPKSGSNLDTNYLKIYLTDQTNQQIKDVNIYNELMNSTKPGGKIIYRDVIEINNDFSAKTVSEDFRLRLWIDESYGELSAKTFSFDIYLYAFNVPRDFSIQASNMVRREINAKVNATTNACNPVFVDDMGTQDESDDITYFSGTNDCVDMNYVWYSGKLWRITAIYPDGAMKLVTANIISTITYNSTGQTSFYTNANTTSYIYNWLNEEFYGTLHGASGLIDTTKTWNATTSNSSSTRLPNTTLVNSNVGLLNSYDYYNSFRCIGSDDCTGTTYSSGYLNISYKWWLLNPYDSSTIWLALMNLSNADANNALGVRPSIILKPSVDFIGSGSSSDPYRIIGDKPVANSNDLINTRMSGEYVMLKNGSDELLFRIIDVDENKTKILFLSYTSSGSDRLGHKFATETGASNTLWGSGTTTEANTLYTYLNSTFYPNLVSTYGNIFTSGKYYLGQTADNYKLTVCANTTSGNTNNCTKTSQVGTFDIGVTRYGEMFSSQPPGGQNSACSIWLITGSGQSVWQLGYNGTASLSSSINSSNCSRPTIYLKSTVKILSGSGTESAPYVVGL